MRKDEAGELMLDFRNNHCGTKKCVIGGVLKFFLTDKYEKNVTKFSLHAPSVEQLNHTIV